jgi:bifunctional non-homologous end joining protein LigD
LSHAPAQGGGRHAKPLRLPPSPRRVKRSVTFEPCFPRSTKEPPGGTGWLHEIKHDCFRIVAQKEGANVRLITRNS